jgi:hypothetical protein
LDREKAVVRQDSRDSEIASGSTYSASPSIDSGRTITRSTRGISPVATFSSFRIARGSFPQSPVKRGLSAETRTAWVASLARFTPAKPRIADGEHHEAGQRKRDHVSSHRPHLRHKKRGRPRSQRDRFRREPYLSDVERPRRRWRHPPRRGPARSRGPANVDRARCAGAPLG